MKNRTFSSLVPLGFGIVATFIAAAAQAQTVYVGNSLSVPNGGEDGVGPLAILGEYNPAGPSATSPVTLPTGIVQDVQFFGDNYDFTLYALSLVGSNPGLNEQTFQVVASESFSGSAPTGVQTLAVSGFAVSAGDLLAFAGIGPYYSQNPNDALNSDATYGDSGAGFSATPPGGPGTQFTVGVTGDANANYDYVPDVFQNQGRNYGIGVDVSVPDSGSTLLMATPIMAALAAMKRRNSSRV
jgi:hypothetical protein